MESTGWNPQQNDEDGYETWLSFPKLDELNIYMYIEKMSIAGNGEQQNKAAKYPNHRESMGMEGFFDVWTDMKPLENFICIDSHPKNDMCLSLCMTLRRDKK